MKTKEDILKENYLIGDFAFSNDTPLKTANKLIELYHSKDRIVLDYGDLETKTSWGETYDVTGYIGASKGAYGIKYPILVHNSRSLGGTMILTKRILSIKLSKGKRTIFEH